MDFAQKLADTLALLKKIEAEYSPALLAHSFGAEDMVLTDIIARNQLNIESFSLDTGRLPVETYALMGETTSKYPQFKVITYFPQASDVEAYVNNNGINAFTESVELRKECCRIRKLEPLKRALAGKKAWITGLRREQSPTRTDMTAQEHDAAHGMEKFNPLIEWTEKEIWAYIRENGVPYNALHDKRYPSIGCAPCTRSIAAGEDIRAGRWWWENPELKECGLHARKL